MTTTVLMFVPTFSWPAAPGGKLHTYLAGGTTATTTWSDLAGSVPNTNPVTLDSTGSATVRLDPAKSYHFVLKDSTDTTTLWDQDNYQGGNLTLAGIGQLLYPQTAAETAASVTPVNYYYAPGNINRYQTNTTPGTTDMSTGLTNALSQAGQSGGAPVYLPGASYLLGQASSFTLPANSTIYGDGKSSLLTFSFNTGTNLAGASVNNVTVRDLRIAVSGTGTGSGYWGVVQFSGSCTNCTVRDNDISGASMYAVLIQDGTSCTVRDNYIHGDNFVSANGDGGGIMLRGTAANGALGCNYCQVVNNRISTVSFTGIEILTGAGVSANNGLNKYNLVSGNRVYGTPAGYGILASYSGNGNYDLFNEVVGNYIENVQGANAAGGSAGAGIYAVAAGGLTISNNIIRNCCVTTANESLAPAGIGINGTVSGMTPCVVSNNLISGMTQYHGIDITSCAGMVNVTGNTILHPVSNTTGNPIKINGSSLASVTDNQITCTSTNQSILVLGNTGPFAQITIADNTLVHSGTGIQFSVLGGTPFSKAIVKGNNCTAVGNNNNLVLAGIANGTIADNVLDNGSNNAPSCTINACTNLMVTGNWIQGGSSVALTTTGTCTGTFIDKSNYINCAAASRTGQNAITNGATGLHVEQLGSAAPANGTSVLGDIVYNTAGATPWGWMATAGGSPGTWTGLTLP